MTAETAQQTYAALLLAKHCLLLALLVTTAYTDLQRGKVYNWCTYPAIGLGLGLGYILDGFTPGHYFHTLNSVLGLALAGMLFALPYFLGWIGGGDLKLAAAVGALAGAQARGHFFVIYAMVYAALVGFVLGMGALVWKGQFWSGMKRSLRVLIAFRRAPAEPASGDPEALTLPYGFAIAVGSMLAWFVFLYRDWLIPPRL